jgi:hypothetical protein
VYSIAYRIRQHSCSLDFQIRLDLEDTKTDSPMIARGINVSAAVDTKFTVNGIVKHIGPQGLNTISDSGGNITNIEQCPDMYSTSVEIRFGDSSSADVITIDPSKMVKEKLYKIADSENVEKHPIFKDDKGSPEDIEMGIKAFRQLKNVVVNVNMPPDDMQPLAEKKVEQVASVINATAGGALWHWVASKVSSLQNVFVKWAQGAWNFVIECAGKIWNFVVKTAGQALRAIRWLLEDVLHILITAIIDAVGFLFRWQDILDTHDLLVHVTNKGLDWMAEGAGLLAEGVDFLLDDVKKIITDFATPDSMKDKSFGASATYSGEAQKEGEVLNSPGGNWGSYQMQHGGTTKSLESDKTEGIFPQEIIDELGTMVEQVISKFTTLIPTISANLTQ